MTGRLWILRSRKLHCQVVLGHHFCMQRLEESWVTVCQRACERFVVVCMTAKSWQALVPLANRIRKHHSQCLQRGWLPCLNHRQSQDPTMAAKQTWNNQTSNLGYKHFLQVHWCARSSCRSEREEIH